MSPMEVNENGDHDYKPPKKKSDDTEDKRKRKIVPGSLMKALIRPGAGEATPTDGDQVIYHCTIRTLDGVVVESSRSEFGGKGIAIRHVLGKSKMILGLLEGLTTMKKGEVAMFKMKPELHYGEDDCPVSVSDAFPKDAELHFETEMIDFSKVKVIVEDMGVLKKVIDEGEGWELPREPYEVKAWISAKTGDGKLIVSHTQGEPFFFTLGKFEVPKGLEMGIGTMSRGEKAVIYVTSQYLTQCSFLPLVEGIEEVHFEVELVHFIQVRDVLGDGRLIKRRIHDGKEPGQVLHAKRISNAFARCRNLMLHSENAMNLFLSEFPMDCPLQDSLLRVHYKGMLLNDGRTIFYDTKVDNGGQPLEFSSGEGLVPEGFEMCVRLMLPEEIALVTCPPDYAYDKFPRPSNVPEGAHVQWEIELLSFEMQKDWTGMNFRSIMDDVEKTKGTGNRLFKEGKFELAKAKYEKVLREFKHVNPQDDEEGKEFLNTRNLLHLNVAACYLNMGMCRNSIDECNKVLDASPVHAKALYRRGLAYMAAGDFEEARSDFSKMMSIDKSSERNARAALLKLKQKEQEVKMKARKQFKGLFDKKPGEIAEAGTVDRGDQSDVDNSEKDNQDDTIRDKDDTEESVHVAAPLPHRMGLLSHLWSTSKNLFTALGVQRCTIL